MAHFVMHSPPGAETVIDGRRYLYFAGTGYLGLQGHPEVIAAACEAVRRYGVHSATSRTGFGNTPPVLEVEAAAARFFGVEDSFYYVSGYVGNHILVSFLDGTFDAVFLDEASHYSLVEAVRLGGGPVFTFGHRDPDSLRARLRVHLRPGNRPLVLSDGVFAGLGTIAPAGDYLRVLADFPGATLLLDDAHAAGVLGDHGRGTYEHFGLLDARVNGIPAAAPGPRLLFHATLSKAIGGFGGILPGTRPFIEDVKRRSRYYGGASAPPIAAAASTARALELVLADPGLRTRLRENVGRMKAGLRRLGLTVDDTPVPIICLTLGSAADMRRIQEELMRRGIAIAYMAAYSGLGPQGGLRIAVFATHTEAMIEQFLDELAGLL